MARAGPRTARMGECQRGAGLVVGLTGCVEYVPPWAAEPPTPKPSLQQTPAQVGSSCFNGSPAAAAAELGRYAVEFL
jgi:hypothetical protein